MSLPSRTQIETLRGVLKDPDVDLDYKLFRRLAEIGELIEGSSDLDIFRDYCWTNLAQLITGAVELEEINLVLKEQLVQAALDAKYEGPSEVELSREIIKYQGESRKQLEGLLQNSMGDDLYTFYDSEDTTKKRRCITLQHKEDLRKSLHYAPKGIVSAMIVTPAIVRAKTLSMYSKYEGRYVFPVNVITGIGVVEFVKKS